MIGIKIAGRNINNLKYADNTTLMAESKEEQKSLLMMVKVKTEKTWRKAQHSINENHDISPITSWQIDGEKVETVTDLFSWAPKSLWMVTAAMTLKDTSSLEEKLWQN